MNKNSTILFVTLLLASLAELHAAEPPAAASQSAANLVGEPCAPTIHYHPPVGSFGDPIPFFWKGEYHVFHLSTGVKGTPWQHIVSTDLIHWRQLPTALVASGPPDGPDGGFQYTGSVTEKDGTFHIFYCGHNPQNPLGTEFTLHATSSDLITWTKHPQDIIGPDGVIYRNERQRGNARWVSWRDAYVFWNEDEQQHWMIMCSSPVKGGGTGLLTSKDLRTWKYEQPLAGGGVGECPDMFKIGKLWYLIGAGKYAVADSPRGPYREPPVCNAIDRPFIYAGKRMFDGKRHIWTGWFGGDSPRNGNKKGGGGGTQCMPRELYADPGGQLYCKPVAEIIAVFKKTVLSKENIKVDATSTFDVPDNYMIECQVQLDPKAELVIALRQQPESGDAYRFTLSPEKSEAGLSVPEFSFKRPCPVDTTKPIKFQAFVHGKFVECFINDQYATSCRAYSYFKGKLTFEVKGGNAKVLSLSVKTDDGVLFVNPEDAKKVKVVKQDDMKSNK